jgi:ComF family protein
MRIDLLRRILAPVVDFIYPRVCRICNAALNGDESIVCAHCWQTFRPVSSDHPVWKEIKLKLCADGAVDDLLSCFLFEKEGVLQNVIHLLKYGGMPSVGVRLGRELGCRYRSLGTSFPADIVVPVPLHRRKKRERGYNQAEYLCTGFAEATGVPVMNSLLVRTKFTVSQTQLGLSERKENVAGAFALAAHAEHLLRGRTVVLVDDVITTGSTLGACAVVARRGGAERVLAASIALAQ